MMTIPFFVSKRAKKTNEAVFWRTNKIIINFITQRNKYFELILPRFSSALKPSAFLLEACQHIRLIEEKFVQQWPVGSKEREMMINLFQKNDLLAKQYNDKVVLFGSDDSNLISLPMEMKILKEEIKLLGYRQLAITNKLIHLYESLILRFEKTFIDVPSEHQRAINIKKDLYILKEFRDDQVFSLEQDENIPPHQISGL